MIISNDSSEVDVQIPLISKRLAIYLKTKFSADVQISQGLLSDPNVKASEGFLLGFLAGLGFASQQIDIMIDNQDTKTP